MIKFDWEECGRQQVARVAGLKVTVRKKGSYARGDEMWIVSEVFGASHLGSRWHDRLQDALREAERLAIREARSLCNVMRGGKGTP